MAKLKSKTTTRIEGEPLHYRLNDPDFTIYHRAALGGLAATILAWGDRAPDGISAIVTDDTVTISWDDGLPDTEAVERLLSASFKLTPDKLIDLPGLGIPADRDDLRLAIHDGIVQTFLQHPKMRPGEKGARIINIKSSDDDGSDLTLSYKAINSYAHQLAQGTELLSAKSTGQLPLVASIPQSIVPGALTGAHSLQDDSDKAFLLMYLVVGSSTYLLRPRTQGQVQVCIIVPDVCNLRAFGRAIHRIAGGGRPYLSNTYLNRVVGGAEEAALRLLIDLRAADASSERSVAGCEAIAMGKVSWDQNQLNKSATIQVRPLDQYKELEVFRAALRHLGQTKIQQTKKGESYTLTASPLPELVAANLSRGRHWCSHFNSLVADKKQFGWIASMRRGLIAMKEEIKDMDDKAIIRSFHEAWRLTMGAFAERERAEGASFERSVEVERERMRNAILRCKTSDALAGWFLRFCADATRGASLGPLRDDAQRVREFIFNPRNFERFQNLCLFALVSYGTERDQQPKEMAR